MIDASSGGQAAASHDGNDPDWYDKIGGGVKRFVRVWRRFDAWALQPLARNRAPGWQVLAPADYPWFIPALCALLVMGVTVGPSFGSHPIMLGLLGLGIALMGILHAAAMRSDWLRERLLGGYLAILALLGALLVAANLAFAPDDVDLNDNPLRLHIGPAMVVALVLMLTIASMAAAGAVRRLRGDAMPGALRKVELFPPNSRYDYIGDTPKMTVAWILLMPLRRPEQLLLPAALAGLVLPEQWNIRWICAGFLAVTWLALVAGILFERLMEILDTLGRLFFIGPQRVVSVIVIAIAIARVVVGAHYITYLFAVGDDWTINWLMLSYMLFAYSAAWFYGFWCEILLARRFLRVLAGSRARVMEITYDFEGPKEISRVENANRVIALHGAGRLRLEGTYEKGYPEESADRNAASKQHRALSFLTPREALAEFRSQLEDRPGEREEDPLPRVRDLQRAVLIYPGVTGLLAAIFIGGPLAHGYFWTAQPPTLDIAYDGHINMRLEPLLLGNGQSLGAPQSLAAPEPEGCGILRPEDPRIAFAASGGGTRAAIYTASVLRGLAKEGRICNVILASGVSGGAAALAYFALHEDELRRPGFDPHAWDKFEKVMARPYFQEVLYAASDSAVMLGAWRWRTAVCGERAVRDKDRPDGSDDERPTGMTPARMRLGSLLAESFVCAMGPGAMRDVPFGLILNTGVAGRFVSDLNPSDSLPAQARQDEEPLNSDSSLAGARLVLSNLPEPGETRRLSNQQGTSDLAMITINDPNMSVARGAALSANFPPVFSDAALDERGVPREGGKGDARYWVTDGGTVENRGVVTLYYAIRDTITRADPELEHEQARAIAAVRTAPKWPPLHVVIADASAVGGTYSESYGFRSLQSAGGQMGLALEGELLKELSRLYDDHKAEVAVHELKMPAVLRDEIGTHWMLPNSLEFSRPATEDRGVASESERDAVTLSQTEILAVVRGMFQAPRGLPSEAAETVMRWTCWQDERELSIYVTAWLRLAWALDFPALVPCFRPRTPDLAAKH